MELPIMEIASTLGDHIITLKWSDGRSISFEAELYKPEFTAIAVDGKKHVIPMPTDGTVNLEELFNGC